MTSGRRVVVTGVGPVTGVGLGRAAFDAGLRAGRSGIGPLRSPTVRGFPVGVGGEVVGFDPTRWVSGSAGGGRCAALAVAAGRLALADAGLDPGGPWAAAAGLTLGTTDGEAYETDRLVEQAVRVGWAGVPSGLVVAAAPDRLAVTVARELGLGGEAMTTATACAAGNYAIGNAFDLVAEGSADVALAGGADAISRKSYAGFARLGAIAPDTCRPFDLDRKGMIPAEGAGVVVLESLEHATARGARVLAEVLGYGISCDAKHPTSPDPDGVAVCIRRAHAAARVTPGQIDYISPHGTGTRVNDVVEVQALRAVFGDRLPPVSSIKSMLGHTMGAASTLGTIAGVLAITGGYLPPTVNFRTPDPECPVDCVPNVARPAAPRVVQNNGFAFAGNNAVLVLAAYRD